MPAFALFMGALMFAAEAGGGDLRGGASALAVMSAFAALLALGAHNEVVRVLRGEHDERTALIDLRATAYTGVVLVVAILGAYLVQVARGDSGAPYAALGALAGATYLVALFVGGRRT